MITYKIDIIAELQNMGFNGTTAKKTGVFGGDTMKKFREGDTRISIEVLNRLCTILEMQPRDILKYTEVEADLEIIKKIKGID